MCDRLRRALRVRERAARSAPPLDLLRAHLVRELPLLALLDGLPGLLPALNHEARLALLFSLRTEAPPELFAAAYDLAARVLAAREFRALEQGLGAGRAAAAA